MLSPNRLTVERAVRWYVAAGSGIASDASIPGNMDGPAPVELYATTTLISAMQEGINVARGDATLQNLVLTYSVQWHRDGAGDAGARFLAWTSSDPGRLFARRRGLTLHRCGPLRQLDALVSGEFEERVGLDLTVGLVARLEEEVPRIATIPLELRYDGADDAAIEVSSG